jgi:hypothetical protein
LRALDVVQTLGEKIEVDDVGRSRHASAKLTEEYLATDQLKTHKFSATSNCILTAEARRR